MGLMPAALGFNSEGTQPSVLNLSISVHGKDEGLGSWESIFDPQIFSCLKDIWL